MHAVPKIASSTFEYWLCLTQFVFSGQRYSDCAYFANDLHAKVQVFSLSLIFKLWGEKHYRSASFQQDMLDNLRNVAIPGTGIPLSFFCRYKLFVLAFVFVLNPVICFFGAWNRARSQPQHWLEFMELLGQYYVESLLHPTDWFSLWRMNCRLVSYHSMVTNSSEYKMEDKWTFLVQGKEMGIPVSPYFDKIEAIVCKNKLIEGGMGIHFYKNAAFGGDWIIQEKLQNAPWLNELLPGNAPLSTMRVITTSTYSLCEEYPLKKELSMIVASAMSQEDELDPDTTAAVTVNYSNGQTARYSAPAVANTAEKSSLIGRSIDHDHCRISDLHVSLESKTDGRVDVGHNHDGAKVQKYIRAESAVLRLGRANAATDHSSILFDVDISTGEIKGGTTNSHWYQLGWTKASQTPWQPPYRDISHHLDAPCPEVKGKFVPNIQEAIDIVTSAHYKMMAEVPIIGWDVAFTPSGIYLLEVNLSCNFFCGSFNLNSYVELLNRYWLHLEKIESLTHEPRTPATKKYSRSSSSLKKDL